MSTWPAATSTQPRRTPRPRWRPPSSCPASGSCCPPSWPVWSTSGSNEDEIDNASALVERHRLTGPLPDGTPYRLLLHSRARLHDAAGRAGEAVDDAEELLRRQDAANVLSAHLVPGLAVAALAHARRGDIDDRQEAGGGEPQARPALGQQPRGRPGAGGRGSGAAARSSPSTPSTAAIEQLAPSPARLDLGWAEYHRGVSLARLGQRADAGAALRSALDIAAGCGATALGRATRATLVHLGFRPRRAALTGVDVAHGQRAAGRRPGRARAAPTGTSRPRCS